jgi:hypothetical protein
VTAQVPQIALVIVRTVTVQVLSPLSAMESWANKSQKPGKPNATAASGRKRKGQERTAWCGTRIVCIRPPEYWRSIRADSRAKLPKSLTLPLLPQRPPRGEIHRWNLHRLGQH